MFGILTRALTVALVLAALTVFHSGTAYADTQCQQTDPATGECLIYVQVPGNPGNPGDAGDDGPKDTGSGSACYWDGTS